jgi:hypothetical protein
MLCAYFIGISQDDIKSNGLYYKISLAGTITTNAEYTFDSDDDTGPFFLPNGLFINNSLGYQFDKRSSIDLNAEYDHYFIQGYNFLPIYLGFNYTIFDFDDVIFVRGVMES